MAEKEGKNINTALKGVLGENDTLIGLVDGNVRQIETDVEGGLMSFDKGVSKSDIGVTISPLEVTGEVKDGDKRAVSGNSVKNAINEVDKVIDSNFIQRNYFDKSQPIVNNVLVDVGGDIPAGEAWLIVAQGWARTYRILIPHAGDYIINGVEIDKNRIYATLLTSDTSTKGVRISNNFTTTHDNMYVAVTLKTPNYDVDINGISIQHKEINNPNIVYSFYDKVIKESSLPNIMDNVYEYKFNPLATNNPDYEIDTRYIIRNHTSKFRLKFDFKINFNANVSNAGVELVNLGGTNLDVILATTILQRENSRGQVDEHFQQVAGCQSGFRFGSQKINRMTPRRKQLTGVDAFSLWLNNFENAEQKQTYLSENSDLEIVFKNNLLVFQKGLLDCNGVKVRDTPIELGFLSLTESGKFLSMNAFYKKLKTYIETRAGLKHFSIDYENLSEDRKCDELLQFNIVKLVLQANLQTEFKGKRNLSYDSFPLFFPYWKDESWHTCEIVSDKGFTHISIDGDVLHQEYTISKNQPIIFGNKNSFTVKDIVINRGNIGDAEVINDKLISNYNPFLITLYGHKTFDQIDPAPITHQDLPRLLRTVEFLKNKGYYIASMGELWEWKKNNKKIPKRTACIILDDWQIENTYENRSVRNKLLKNGAKINFCINEEFYYTIQDKSKWINQARNMRAIGWDICIHTYNHDVAYSQKSSNVIVEELLKNQDLAEELGQDSRIQVYPFGSELTNMQKLLEYKGISLGFDTFHTNSYKSNWGLAMSREPFNQDIQISRIKNSIL